MPSAARLKMVITADGRQARTELESTSGSVLGLSKSVETAGQNIQSVGEKMLLVGGVLDAAILGSAFAAGKFQEDTVALVHGAGESAGALGQVTQGLLDMAGAVGDTPDHLAQGMYLVESAGYHGAAGLQVMEAAAKGARIGMADQATVADAVTSALNAYHLGAADATGVTGQLIQTVASGKMHFQDLAQSLGTVLPAAASAHILLQEVGAAIATMTAQGTPAADAATYLRQTILQLQNPSAKAEKALKSLGFSSTEVADTLTHKGLYAALSLIQEQLSKKFPDGGAQATATLADIVGGTKSMQAALELTGGNLATFAANIKNVGTEGAGVKKFEEDWALVSTTAAEQFDKLKGQVMATVIEIGTALLPSLQQMMATITPIIKQVADFAKTHGDLVAKVLLASAAFFTIGGILLTVAGTITIFLAVLNPVTLVVLGIVAAAGLLTAAWLTNYGGIRDKVLPILATLSAFITTQMIPAIQSVVNWVVTNWPTMQATITDVMNAILAVVMAVIGRVAPFIEVEMGVVTRWWQLNLPLMRQTAETVFNAIKAIVDFVMPYIQKIIQTVMPLIEAYWRVSWAAIQAAVELVWGLIRVVVDTAIHTVLDIITLAMDVLTGNWSGAWATIQDILITNWEAFKQIVNLAIVFIRDGIINPVLAELGTNWDSAWNGIKDSLANVWNGIVNTVRGSVNMVIADLNHLIGAYDAIRLVIPGFSVGIPSVNVPGVGTVGGGTLSWGGFSEGVVQVAPIPALAAGGIVTSPTLALIGERGPEAVVPLGRNGGQMIDYEKLASAIVAAQAKRPTYQINASYRYQSERDLRDDVRMLQMLGAHV